MVLTEEMNKYYTKFMKFHVKVHNAIFQKKFPMVLLDMRNILDLCIDKRIGEWFLFEHGIVIKFYGLFIHLIRFQIS